MAVSSALEIVTRFAPSPTGELHLGHVRSALTGWQAARAAGGRFLLRIEDIDHTRCRPQFEAAILEDLAWLGIAWEEPVRRQSQHMADYSAALRDLSERGLTYRSLRKTSRACHVRCVKCRHGMHICWFEVGEVAFRSGCPR